MTKTKNEIRFKQVEKALKLIVGDQSVTIEETIANLEMIKEKIEIELDALRSS